MPDLKFFAIDPQGGTATECTPTFFGREAQVPVGLRGRGPVRLSYVEQNMETFFGIRFLASEYSTGKKHRGRIDSLGLDENNCPVIIEYKLDSKENVINQGLFYLDWLLDHRSEFQLSAPRLLCIARDFTRYDEYAIGQINRNIELIRYQLFGDQVLFELAKTVAGDSPAPQTGNGEQRTGKNNYRTMPDALESASPQLLDLLQVIDTYLTGLGDDVQSKQLKYYRAYRRLKNFVCLEIKTRESRAVLYCKATLPNEMPPYMRDVSNIGHYGTGDMELTVGSVEELELVKPYLMESYEIS